MFSSDNVLAIVANVFLIVSFRCINEWMTSIKIERTDITRGDRQSEPARCTRLQRYVLRFAIGT